MCVHNGDWQGKVGGEKRDTVSIRSKFMSIKILREVRIFISNSMSLEFKALSFKGMRGSSHRNK